MNPVSSAETKAFPFGGAVRLRWANPADATFDHVVILRKTTNSFSGITDATAVTVYRGSGDDDADYRTVYLPATLANSGLFRTTLDLNPAWATTYYYAIYAANAGETDVSVAVVVGATTAEASQFEETDIIGVLLPFISSYLAREITLGHLTFRVGVADVGVIEGPPLVETVQFPVVSLHLDEDRPTAFPLGGQMDLSTPSTAQRRRGYISQQTVRVQGWTTNPEERRPLYRMLKGALEAARPLLGDLGVANLTVTGQYLEEFQQYSMPLFLAVLTLTGQLETAVRAVPVEPTITEIDINPPTVSAVDVAPTLT